MPQEFIYVYSEVSREVAQYIHLLGYCVTVVYRSANIYDFPATQTFHTFIDGCHCSSVCVQYGCCVICFCILLD